MPGANRCRARRRFLAFGEALLRLSRSRRSINLRLGQEDSVGLACRDAKKAGEVVGTIEFHEVEFFPLNAARAIDGYTPSSVPHSRSVGTRSLPGTLARSGQAEGK